MRRPGWFLAILWALIAATNAVAAIAIDSPGNTFSATSNSASLAYSCGSGVNRLLIVSVAGNNGASVVSMTYGGVALNQVMAPAKSASCRTDFETWYLLAPASGANTLVINWTVTNPFVASCIEYSGVSQATPFGATDSTTGTLSPLSTTINVQNTQSQILCSYGGISLNSLSTTTSNYNQEAYALDGNGLGCVIADNVLISVGTGAFVVNNIYYGNLCQVVQQVYEVVSATAPTPTPTPPPAVALMGHTFVLSATGTGPGPAWNTSASKFFTLQVKGVPLAATSWDVALEGSNDGVNFSDVFEHVSGTQPDGDSEAAIYPILFPYVRANVYSVALGSATALTITVEGSQ